MTPIIYIYIYGTYDFLNDCKYNIKTAPIHTGRAYRNRDIAPFIPNFGRSTLEGEP